MVRKCEVGAEGLEKGRRGNAWKIGRTRGCVYGKWGERMDGWGTEKGGKEGIKGWEWKEGMHSWGMVEEGLKVLRMGSSGWRVGGTGHRGWKVENGIEEGSKVGKIGG